MLEAFGCGRFRPVNAGAVVIVDQGEFLRVLSFEGRWPGGKWTACPSRIHLLP